MRRTLVVDFDRSTHPRASQTLARSSSARRARPTSTVLGRKSNGGASRPLRGVWMVSAGRGQLTSIDLVRPPSGPAGRRCRRPIVTMAVAIAEHEGRRDAELTLEARAPLLPALLILELVLVQRRRLLDAMSQPELDGELAGLLAHLVPGRAERKLIGDRADAARVDVAGQRDGRQDRARPVGGLRVDGHRQDVEVVAAATIAGDHRTRGPR